MPIKYWISQWVYNSRRSVFFFEDIYNFLMISRELCGILTIFLGKSAIIEKIIINKIHFQIYKFSEKKKLYPARK